jgi:hypothetical protein
VNNFEVFQKYSEFHAVSTRHNLYLDYSLPEGSTYRMLEPNFIPILQQKLNVYLPTVSLKAVFSESFINLLKDLRNFQEFSSL